MSASRKPDSKAQDDTGETAQPSIDPVALGHAFAEVYEKAQPVFNEWMKRYSEGLATRNIDPMNIGGAYAEFAEKVMDNPDKFWAMQTDYMQKWGRIWQESALKFLGEKSETLIKPEPGDRRFRAAEWQDSALFDFIKQSYLLASEWMEKTVRSTDGLDPQKKEKLAFYAKLFANALSPSNFVMTNPEVLQETLKTGGGNLIKGLENLIEDMERGGGELRISTTDYNAFELGRNIATTPGKVVFQNDLMQLIQYAPATKDVFKTPLLIVPPWINKYYILDLRSDNSFVGWAVQQGHTVFVVSWVNPTPQLAQKRFEDYMEEGILAALSHIEKVTGEDSTNVIGYCLGGTLLTTTMAYLTAKGKESRVKSATLLTTMIDFEHAGDMKLFLDDEQLEMLDREMAEKGLFEGRNLHQTFSLLRANDLIWSFVVNNYLMGREPFPFDLLYWNDDSTNMPAAMHSFYLRKMYRDNMLTKPGGISMKGVPIDVRTVRTPAYLLSTREDHIAPWKATYGTIPLLSGPVTFTLAASGHIAGVVNAPEKKKYCYWTAAALPGSPDEWLKSARETEGSWWPHWQEWIGQYTGGKTPARDPGKGLEDAPGSYVRVKTG